MAKSPLSISEINTATFFEWSQKLNIVVCVHGERGKCVRGPYSTSSGTVKWSFIGVAYVQGRAVRRYARRGRLWERRRFVFHIAVITSINTRPPARPHAVLTTRRRPDISLSIYHERHGSRPARVPQTNARAYHRF